MLFFQNPFACNCLRIELMWLNYLVDQFETERKDDNFSLADTHLLSEQICSLDNLNSNQIIH